MALTLSHETIGELGAVLEAMGVKTSKQQVEIMIREVDTPGGYTLTHKNSHLFTYILLD
jgi:Ca2+-binding EF-hand superfamily protein